MADNIGDPPGKAIAACIIEEIFNNEQAWNNSTKQRDDDFGVVLLPALAAAL